MKRGCLIGGISGVVLIGVLGTLGARRMLAPAPKVERTETVTLGEVEVRVVENGAIEPLRKVDLKSKVGGRIAKLMVDEGAVVHAGQVLATIDPQEVNSQVAALRAQVAGAHARLEAARKGVRLQQQQTVTGIEQLVQALQVAGAHLKQAEAESSVQPGLTEQSIAAAQAGVEAAQANLKAQQDSLRLMLEITHPQAIVSAQSAYDEAKAQSDNSQRSLKRQQSLLARGYVSQQVVDSAETDYGVAGARLRDSRERLDRIRQSQSIEEANLRSQIASGASQVRQSEAALAEAKAAVAPLMKLRDLESARAAYRQASAQLAAGRAGRANDAIRADEMHASESEVRQLENQLDETLVHQTDTTLVAPMNGSITKRYVEQGELITSAISSFSSGSPVFQIADLATMLIKVNVNEVDISKVSVGTLTEVSSDSARGSLLRAHVRKVAPAAAVSGAGDTSSQGVVRFPVEVQLDQSDVRLRPGMTARCAIIVSRRKGVLRLPVNCIEGKGNSATVQVVSDTGVGKERHQTTASRKVSLGLRGDDFVEVVAGLKLGERVRPAHYSGPARQEIDITEAH